MHLGKGGDNTHIWLTMRGTKGLVDIVQALEVGNAGVDLNNNVLRALQNLRRRANRGTGNDPTILSDRGSLDDGPVQGLGGVTVLLLQGVVAVSKILREHGQVLVGELDATSVDTFGDIFSDLMRVTTGDPVWYW